MFLPITNTSKSQTHRMILTNTSQTHFWFSWVILNRCEYHLHLKSIVIDSFLIFMTSPDNSWHVNNTERVTLEVGTIWAGQGRCGHTFLKPVKKSPIKINPWFQSYFNPIWEGEMRKKSNLHKIVNSAVSTTIEGFPS